MGNSVVKWSLLAVAVALLAGCASEALVQNKSMKRGFNALQHESLPWDQPAARKSISRLTSLGANAVVFIAFMEQQEPSSHQVRRSNAVTMHQLKKAISYAKADKLHVALKPQMLVHNSWAGEINHRTAYDWDLWFANYSREIMEYAIFAQQQGVDTFVIGTELSRASAHVNWPRLIRQVRRVFRGQLTYAAHNVEGVRAFPNWDLLDAVSLTFYPSLGASSDRASLQARVDIAVEELRVAAAAIKRPLWVMEVGIPSAKGASLKPWEWQGLKHRSVDLALQSEVLDIWLRALDQPWVDGIYIWAWYSNARAGGQRDTDYTPQNKPAEDVIGRYW
ncbi:hypothetical protein [Mariprofundus sp. KV]|uniref:glycoside hydrolase family 113 n=1 Tax=Mariprofundus sp. KV TaxID=2608715 RepID=UPI0015A06AEF|nr:hypothetical protein [Mariprofundus sp. KV]NWF36809.1 hypothetical protein [Mariprofundus sp. KV]